MPEPVAPEAAAATEKPAAETGEQGGEAAPEEAAVPETPAGAAPPAAQPTPSPAEQALSELPGAFAGPSAADRAAAQAAQQEPAPEEGLMGTVRSLMGNTTVMAGAVIAVVYLLLAFFIQKRAKAHDAGKLWRAWVPGLNLYLLMKVIRKPKEAGESA